MLFALGVAKIFGVMALSCYVAVLWVRTAHAINERHTEKVSGRSESKMKTLERMAKAQKPMQKKLKNAGVAFSEVAESQLPIFRRYAGGMSMTTLDKNGKLSITFHSDSSFVSEYKCANSEIATAKTDWEFYGDNIINFAGKKKRKQAVP